MATTLHTNKDKKALYNEAADLFRADLQTRQQGKIIVTVGLCGGDSVRDFYGAVTNTRYMWDFIGGKYDKVHFFLTDERFTDTPTQKNYRIAFENSGLAMIMKRSNIYPFPGIKTEVKSALPEYSNSLSRTSGFPPKLEVIVLSAGEDGHIASLFPNHSSIRSQEEGYILVENSPTPQKTRISASPKMIQRADTVFLFFMDERKRRAYEMFNSEGSLEECPSRLVKSCSNVLVFTNLI